MAKFLSTSGITHHLEGIIKGATRRVVLVSPYLRLNDGVRRLIELCGRSDVEVDVLFGKEELQAQEEAWLRSQAHVRIRFLKALHAKCYLNESQAIIASMNLHQYSQQNNVEMGVLVTRSEDRVAFADVQLEVEQLLRAADSGVCIRCRGSIARDPMNPYCPACLVVWKKYQNHEYQEKYCHICREPSPTTRRKPACFDCFQRFSSSLTFPLAPVPSSMRLHPPATSSRHSFFDRVIRLFRR